MNTTASSHDTTSPDLAAALSTLTAAGIEFAEVPACPATACAVCGDATWEPLHQAA